MHLRKESESPLLGQRTRDARAEPNSSNTKPSSLSTAVSPEQVCRRTGPAPRFRQKRDAHASSAVCAVATETSWVLGLVGGARVLRLGFKRLESAHSIDGSWESRVRCHVDHQLAQLVGGDAHVEGAA